MVVLVDGVRLNDPTNSRGGSFDPTTLSLADIERVEIVRGPLSAIYGSDALAGAINVVTRRAAPDDPVEASVRVRGGRFHSGQALARASGGLGGVAAFSLGASIDTFRDPESDGGFDGGSLKAVLGGELPGEIDAEVFARVHESSSRGFPDSSGGSERAVVRTMEDRDVREILVGASLERAFDFDAQDAASTLQFRASRASRREELTSPGIDVVPPLDPIGEGDVPPSVAEDEYARWELWFLADNALPTIDLGATGSLAPRLRVGTNLIWEDGNSRTFLDFSGVGVGFAPADWAENRRTISPFAELELDVAETVTLSGSLRYDAVRGEQDRLSPAVGASLSIPGTTLVVFGNYGEGFKLPSFYARNNPLVGTPTLASERSKGFEVGVRASVGDGLVRAQASYFDLRVRRLIDFNDAIFALENRRRLDSRGVELEIDLAPTDWLGARLGGTWNDNRLRGRGPRSRGSADLARIRRAVRPTRRGAVAPGAGPRRLLDQGLGGRDRRRDRDAGWLWSTRPRGDLAGLPAPRGLRRDPERDGRNAARSGGLRVARDRAPRRTHAATLRERRWNTIRPTGKRRSTPTRPTPGCARRRRSTTTSD